MQVKRIRILILFQAIFSLLQTYFISKISLIGKFGIAYFHKEYALLRSGWKTFFLFFAIQLCIILLLGYLQKRLAPKMVIRAAIALFLLAATGMCFTYADFLHTYSHRLLKERFHLGFYFFWLGWMVTCIFFAITAVPKKLETTNEEPVID